MTILTPGTLCITVGGSGENAGRIVVILSYCGPCAFDSTIKEGYNIRTASGRPFATVRQYSLTGTGSYLLRDMLCDCVTDRRRLRPLIDPNVDAEALTTDFIMQKPLFPKDPALRSQATRRALDKHLQQKTPQQPQQPSGYDADFGRVLTPGEAAMLKALNL